MHDLKPLSSELRSLELKPSAVKSNGHSLQVDGGASHQRLSESATKQTFEPSGMLRQTKNVQNYVLRIRSSFLNSINNALASRRRLSLVKYLILFFHHTPSSSLRHKASKPSIEKLRHRFLLKSRKKQWYSLWEKPNSASFHLTFTHGSVGLTPLKLTTNNSFSAMFPFSSKSSGWTVTSPVLSRGLAYSRRALNPW